MFFPGSIKKIKETKLSMLRRMTSYSKEIINNRRNIRFRMTLAKKIA